MMYDLIKISAIATSYHSNLDNKILMVGKD